MIDPFRMKRDPIFLGPLSWGAMRHGQEGEGGLCGEESSFLLWYKVATPFTHRHRPSKGDGHGGLARFGSVIVAVAAAGQPCAGEVEVQERGGGDGLVIVDLVAKGVEQEAEAEEGIATRVTPEEDQTRSRPVRVDETAGA